MSNSLLIQDLKQSTTLDYTELSAEVDGDRIFFRAPLKFNLECRGEPFLGIALLEAMRRGVNIKLEDSIQLSAKLYDRLSELQSVYSSWNSNLRKITIQAHTEPLKKAYNSEACFWSAGVDSSYTLLRNITKIDQLVMLGGFEVGGNTPEAWRQKVAKQSAFSRSVGKELIPIETNAKQWIGKRKIDWGFAQGLVLASMGSLLKCKRIFIGATHTYAELFPWGSHPLTDPMWSTESTEVIHYGAIRRSKKMIDLTEDQKFLDNLQVCWKSPCDNCGECPKCVRTMTAMYLLKASCKALPKLNGLYKLKKFQKCNEASGATYLEDLMILAKDVRNRQVLRFLRRYYRRYQIRVLIKVLDRYVLGGFLRRVHYRVATPKRFKSRVTLIGPFPWDI